MSKKLDISIIIPIFNEKESLVELTKKIELVMKKHKYNYEVYYIDDGSKDKSWELIKTISKKNKNIKGVQFTRNYGKSAALNTAFKLVKGNVVITLDGDLQDDPNEIPGLYKMIIKEDYDLVSGWKKDRYDNVLTKNIPSKIFNWATQKLSKIKLHDFNCGIKAYKLNVIKSIELYSDMHRYIPVIVKWAGFEKIGEKVVLHHKRKFGVSKYGINRFWNGIIDLILIMFIGKFGKRPIHFFGMVGLFFIFVGTLILAELVIEKLFFHGYQMTQRPIFHVSTLTIIVGIQFFMTGFVAELLLRNSSERNKYEIREKI